MDLRALRVLHLPKGPHWDQGASARITDALPGVFFLDSCQRQLWACSDRELSRASGFFGDAAGEIEVLEGIDAYRFLLRVATGLESQIVGETDIFGQLKEAWRKSSGSGDAELGALMQRLFEDTKDIRSRFLQNVGGASYGSLVRMMLKQSPGPTLVVGAGQLAASVAPYLLDQELWISNRSAEKLVDLHLVLLAQARGASRSFGGLGGPNEPKIRVISRAEEESAWRDAAAVVACIPFDADRDAERAGWRANASGPVIHLGGRRDEAGIWNGLPEFQALDDLFALKKSQGDVRMTQVRLAARACDEKAKLRALGASVTIPHGWEDLAVFA